MKRPRFSLLLPTCNRLALLRQAVDSIRDQAFSDFEIVISDNASEEDIGTYARAVGDPRVVYSRAESRLDVTDNWNRALGFSSGELILMLGDDDGLSRGYLSRLDRLAREYDADAIYTGAFLLTYPGVSEQFPGGELRPYGYARFMQNGGEVRPLLYEERRQHVAAMLGAHVSFGFNMQFLLFTRRLLERLAVKGPFFQSLFPDYYAMIACFLEAERLMSFRRDCVFIGVSPKSYGFYYQNRKEQEGAAFLHNATDARDPENLPGSHIVRGWQDAAEAIVRNFGARHALRMDPWTFRLRQISHNAEALHQGHGGEIASEFFSRLRPAERTLWRLLTAPVVGRPISFRLAHRLRLVPFDWSPQPISTSVESLDEARALPATFLE